MREKEMFNELVKEIWRRHITESELLHLFGFYEGNKKFEVRGCIIKMETEIDETQTDVVCWDKFTKPITFTEVENEETGGVDIVNEKEISEEEAYRLITKELKKILIE